MKNIIKVGNRSKKYTYEGAKAFLKVLSNETEGGV
jgi:hypothetical protein